MTDTLSNRERRLPGGTIAFLLTDVEGSTALWDAAPDGMRAALARHDALISGIVERHGGVVVKTRGEGDSVFTVFVSVSEAVAAALAIQRDLAAEPWPTPRPLRVRIGVHVGEAQLRDGDYYGATVNRCARLRAIGHGGQILLSEVTAALVRDGLPAGTALLDLGLHRLKDLARPERVFQLTADDLGSEFPPLRSLDAHRHNLPIQGTPFVGREHEIAALRALLGRDAVRLATLTGPGGTGKTRLSMQVAAELTDAFQDGVFWVDLAPISDPALVISTVAQTLGVADTAGRPILDAVVERLRAATMLLLLDNFEQVLDAASTVDSLLQACPGLVLLVTSRAPLQLRVEHEFPVPPLSLPDAAQVSSPEALSQYEAVALFVERACAIRPDFAMTNANAPAVAEICARLDGLPLAIELAAARLRLLSPEAMLPRLGHGLGLLSGGRRDLPARQQTLRSTIAWSHDLLSEPEQLLFRRLSVFVGGFTLEAIESVGSWVVGDGGGDGVASSPITQHRSPITLDLVEHLVAQSLVRAERESGPEPRFRMLETIREFAAEQLEASGEGAAARDRHLAWCADLAGRAARDIGGSAQAAWLDVLDREHDNLRAALRWADSARDPDGHGLRIAASLCKSFWAMRGHHREGRAWLDRLLSYAPARTDVRAQALRGAGRLALRQNDYPAATEALSEALAIFRELGDRRGTAEVLSWYGVVPHHLGRYDEAQAMLEESLAISRELDDDAMASFALRFLADLAQDRGDFPRAVHRYEETLAVARARNVAHDIAYATRGLGHVARAQGQYALAGERLRESLALLKPLRDRRCIPLSLEGLACITVGPAWADRAARLLGAAQAMQAQTGAPSPPSAAADYQRTVADARKILGSEQFERAWAAGAAMGLDEAIDLALSEPDHEGELGGDQPTTAERAGSQDRDVPLSAREREVVALIADGLSNRQIAERLVLSVRTVERHIENVYNRLGISGKAGRAIVTAYALRHHLIETA